MESAKDAVRSEKKPVPRRTILCKEDLWHRSDLGVLLSQKGVLESKVAKAPTHREVAVDPKRAMTRRVLGHAAAGCFNAPALI
eukprot:2244688-Alexandrium_andersonii.AAC.1